MNVSTRNLNALPDIAGLMRLTQSLAILDAVLSQEWEYRYYSFNHAWADGEKMASMRNGSGDQWFAIFSAAGAALHGVLREAPMYRPGPPPGPPSSAACPKHFTPTCCTNRHSPPGTARSASGAWPMKRAGPAGRSNRPRLKTRMAPPSCSAYLPDGPSSTSNSPPTITSATSIRATLRPYIATNRLTPGSSGDSIPNAISRPSTTISPRSAIRAPPRTVASAGQPPQREIFSSTGSQHGQSILSL